MSIFRHYHRIWDGTAMVQVEAGDRYELNEDQSGRYFRADGSFVDFGPGDLMQCTGMRDKNGSILYEQDHVAAGSLRLVVFWQDGGFFLKPIIATGDWDDIEVTAAREFELCGNSKQP